MAKGKDGCWGAFLSTAMICKNRLVSFLWDNSASPRTEVVEARETCALLFRACASAGLSTTLWRRLSGVIMICLLDLSCRVYRPPTALWETFIAWNTWKVARDDTDKGVIYYAMSCHALACHSWHDTLDMLVLLWWPSLACTAVGCTVQDCTVCYTVLYCTSHCRAS